MVTVLLAAFCAHRVRDLHNGCVLAAIAILFTAPLCRKRANTDARYEKVCKPAYHLLELTRPWLRRDPSSTEIRYGISEVTHPGARVIKVTRGVP